MKHKAIKDLNQLSDNNFYKEISIGLEKIYENCIERIKGNQRGRIKGIKGVRV